MGTIITYPTPEHAQAAAAITNFWTANYDIEAVLLVNSCARGKATKDSCLDINILARPKILRSQLATWEKEWEAFNQTNPAIQAMERVGKYSVVHLDIVDGQFEPQEQDEVAGPDYFEVGIGNMLHYSKSLWQGGSYFKDLQKQWLPYYDETMRRAKLKSVRFFCLNNLHHIPLYLDRGLYFQAFDRLYNAFQEFLQALFIARRTYPITYDKWIHEQLVDILQLPELYAQVTKLFEISHFESQEMLEKAQTVERLLEEYAPEPA